MLKKVSRTTPTTISKPDEVTSSKPVLCTKGDDQTDQPGQDRHDTQEESTRQGDAAQHTGQVALRGCTTANTRDLCANPLQVLTIVLLCKQNIGVEEGEQDHHQEVHDPVSIAAAAKHVLTLLGKVRHASQLLTSGRSWQ